MYEPKKLMDSFSLFLKAESHKAPKDATPVQLHKALSKAVMSEIADNWEQSRQKHLQKRHAYYFSAEFLVGRAIFNNLLCMGVIGDVEKMLNERGASLKNLEEIEDAALGNGGLGRLAACFLDSAATLNLPLDGYGIRYKYGLFKQSFENGFQKEEVDDWTRHGDPWSIRCEEDAVTVKFKDQTVRAVPYDMPVIGYATENIGTLRLWQAEPTAAFDFTLFNDQEYDEALEEKNRAEDISRVLYPNDTTVDGKKLRLRQQYFFCCASLQDIVKKYKEKHGGDFSKFAELNSIQLNDTHPVISIPELIRQLMDNEGMTFDKAFSIAQKTFNYTNHTIMSEALEKWDKTLMQSVVPRIYEIIELIEKRLEEEFLWKNVDKTTAKTMRILQDGKVHMAYLAVYATRFTNGVARLHTEILKDDVLHDWFEVYPERFQNKTNGITQRRWLALCNPELTKLLEELAGNDEFKRDLSKLKALERFQDDESVLRRFMEIKRKKHEDLARYVLAHDGVTLDPCTIYDVQIKRLHEYKRQFLNILAILELYFEIKEGSLKEFTPTTFLFGAKSAPGYERAKGIIKLVNAVADLIDNDPDVKGILKVVFVSNYNVSYAEQLVAAADVSEQISTAGTEASGTGNMKLMLNGAVTLGTFDGANVEIVEEAGRENNYIFGATVEEIEAQEKKYDPMALYKKNLKIRRVLDALSDGTLSDGGTGIFKELKDSILKGASWHKPDQYYLLLDFESYLKAKIQVNRDYNDRLAFSKKCWVNICNSGKFSSDRTIAEYARDIWRIEAV